MRTAPLVVAGVCLHCALSNSSLARPEVDKVKLGPLVEAVSGQFA